MYLHNYIFCLFGIFSVLFQVKSISIFKEFFIRENNVRVRDKVRFFVKTILPLSAISFKLSPPKTLPEIGRIFFHLEF